MFLVVSSFACCVGVGLVLGYVMSCYVAWWHVLWRSLVARCFVACYVVLFAVSSVVCCVEVGLVLGSVVSSFVAWWRVLWRSVVSRFLVLCYVVMFCCCCFRWGLLGCLSAALFCGSGCGPYHCFSLLCGSFFACFIGMFVACRCCVVWCRVSCRCVLSSGRMVLVLCLGMCCVVACCVVVLCFGALGCTLVCGVEHCNTVLCVVTCRFVALYSMLRCVPLLIRLLWISSCCRACCCVLCLGVAWCCVFVLLVVIHCCAM